MKTTALSSVATALALLSIIGSGCLPATNPFDPSAPPSAQAPAEVKGWLVLDDVATTSYQISLLDNAGTPLRDDSGDLVQVNTRVEGDDAVEGLEDAVPGSFHFPSVVPGTVIVRFDASDNGRVDVSDAELRGLELTPGASPAPIVLAPQTIADDQFTGRVVVALENVSAGDLVVVALAREDGAVRRAELANGASEVTFNNVSPGTWRATATGEGYAPAVSAQLQVQASEVTTSLSLLTLGPLFALTDFVEASLPLAPYLPEDTVRDPTATPGLVTAHVQLDAGLVVAQSPDDTFSVEMRIAEESAFASAAWQPGTGDAVDVTLDPTLPDGPRDILAQLRLCFEQQCTCPSPGDDGCDDPTFREPLTSGVTTLSVVVDREGPRALLATVGGVSRQPVPEGADGDWVQSQLVSCAQFGSPLCDEAANTTWRAPIVLELFDESGRVYGHDSTLDDEQPPETPGATTGLGAFVTVSAQTRDIDKVDGDRALRLFAWDAAGNVSLVEQRALLVDVTPLTLASPALSFPAGVTPDPAGDPNVEVVGGGSFMVDVDTEDESPARWRVVLGDSPVALNGALIDGFVAYTGASGVTVTAGNHLETVGLIAEVEDLAGNRTRQTTARELTVFRESTLVGQVGLEGTADVTGVEVRLSRAGTQVLSATVGSPGAADLGGPAAATLSVGSDGALLADHLPVAVTPSSDTETWTLEVLAPSPWGVRSLPVGLLAATTVDVGLVQLVLPRGDISGRFVLAGQDGTANNSGIQVTLLDSNGAAVAGASTLADGGYRFDDVAVGTYSVVGAANGHLASTVAGVAVMADQTTAVQPNPVELTVLSGDFTLCAATGALEVDCAPVLYTNADAVQIGGIDLTGFTEFRIATTAFASDAPTPSWSALTELSPGEVEAPSVDLSAGAEGRVTVYLQLRVDAANAGAVLSSDVIYDVTPPTGLSLTLQSGAAATMEGFTNQTSVVAQPSATSASADEAPLASHRVVFADVVPTILPTTTLCPVVGTCTVPLEDTTEGTHTAWSFSCDLAGNCTLPSGAATAQIVVDTTPPRPSHGFDIAPVGTGIVFSGGVYYTRTASYGVQLSVGTAETDAGAEVRDLDNNPVADVARYRFGFNSQLTGSSWTTLDPLVAAGGSREVAGAALSPVDGTTQVFVQLADGAGNVTDLNGAPLSMTLNLDSTPPSLTFTLDGGAVTTRDVVVDLGIVENAVDPVASMWIGVDPNFNPGQYEARTFPLTDTTFSLPAAPAPGGDGAYVVYARFFDVAGNYADRSASITLDRVAPTATFLSCQDCTTVAGEHYAVGTDVELDALAQDNLGTVAQVSVVVTHQATGFSSLSSTVAYDGSVDVDLVVLDGGGAPVSPAGRYDVSLTFTDPAGNTSAPATLTLAYDPTPPSAPGGLAVAATAGFTRITSPAPCTASSPCLNDPRPLLSFSSSADNLDPSLTYRVEIAEGGDFVGQLVASAERAVATPLIVPSSLPDGSYGFRVSAIDDAGNTATSSVATFIIDTAGPDAPSLLPPPSPVSAAVESNINLQWTSEPGAVAYDFQVTQDGAGFDAAVVDVTLPGISYDVRSALVSGGAVLHHVRVRSIDALGNTSAWSFGQLVHDDVPPCQVSTPTVSLVGTDAANNYSSSAVVNVILTCPGGGQRDMRLACDGVLDTESVESFAPVSTCALADGPRTVDAEVYDAAGNVAAATADSITVDGTPPSIPRFAEQGGTLPIPLFDLGALALASVDTGSGLASPAYEIHWPNVTNGFCPSSVNASGWCPWDGSTPRTLALIEGENRIRVRAVDAAGNVSDDDLLVVVVDTLLPGPVSALDADAGNGEVTVSWSPPSGADDVEGYQVFYGAPADGQNCTSVTPSSYTGQNADQGVSPIDVGENTVLRLTGLAAGTPVCVGVRAYDSVNDGTFSVFSEALLPNEVAPRVMGTWTPPAGSAVRAVAVRRQIAYVPHGCASAASCAGAGFSTVDVSDPDHPVTLGTCSNSSYTGMFDVALLGDYAYVANGKWVEIIDVADPTSLTCSSYATVPDLGTTAFDYALSVAVSPGDGSGPGHLVVASLDGGVTTYTLSSPTSPIQVGSYRDSTAGQFRAHAVTLQGDYAYVALSGTVDGLRILDISNLSSPTLMPTIFNTVPTWDVDVSGSRVAVIRNGGTHIFDIPDPTVSQTLTTADAVATRFGQAVDVMFYGPYLYVADEDAYNGRHNIDVLSQRNLNATNPDLPLSGRSTATPYPAENLCTAMPCENHPAHDFGHPRRMAVEGLYLFEANKTDGLVVRRLSRPITLEEVATQVFSGGGAGDPGGHGVEVFGHRLLFARSSHLVPVDLSDPEAPVQGTSTNVDHDHSSLERVGDRFIFGGGTGFVMLRPNPDGTFTATSTWNDGNAGRYTKLTHTTYPYVQVVTGADGYYAPNPRLVTVDLRTLGSVADQSLGLGTTGSWYADLARHREALYVSAAGQSNVAVVDLSTPSSPVVRSPLSVGVSAFGLAVHRDRLLVSIINNLRSYGLTDPNAPDDQLALGVSPGRWMHVSGDVLMGADQPQGVVISVDDVSAPALVGYGGNIALEMNVLLFGKHAVLTDRHDFSLISLE